MTKFKKGALYKHSHHIFAAITADIGVMDAKISDQAVMIRPGEHFLFLKNIKPNIIKILFKNRILYLPVPTPGGKYKKVI